MKVGIVLRYLYHPESDSLFTEDDSKPFPDDPLIVELDESNYWRLRYEQRRYDEDAKIQMSQRS